jgi:PAS domain S-box-containing protein
MAHECGILVVDDDPAALELFQKYLSSANYLVWTANDGETALTGAAQYRPDVILLGIRIPRLNGFEVCRRLKADVSTAGIPVIFVSVPTATDEHVEGFRVGGVDFVTKPVQPAVLLSRIATHLDLHRLRTRLEEQVAVRTLELDRANSQLQAELIQWKRVGDALRESEQQFRIMADTAPAMIWTGGPDNFRKFFNKAWLAFRCRSLEQEQCDGWMEGIHSDDLHRVLEAHSSAVNSRQAFETEYRLRRGDGEFRWVLDIGVPRIASSGAFIEYIGSCLDTTGLRRTHEQRLASEKMDSLAVLAAGIAQHYNNLFGAILTESDIALSEIPNNCLASENISRISAMTIRAAEVLKLLSTYAGGGGSARFELLDTSELIGNVICAARNFQSKTIVLNKRIATQLPRVFGNGEQLQQVIWNLLSNGYEALEQQGGTLTVTADVMEFDSGPSKTEGQELAACDYVRISITDTGPGMDYETRAKIFDPFYTTKFPGRGLGLAVAQGVVRSHGGHIRVTSSRNTGTTFEILLPCAVQVAKA